jgi:hypothetical protein
MASDKLGLSGSFFDHFTIAARVAASARKPINGFMPVRGRPMTFCLTFFDFFILFV